MFRTLDEVRAFFTASICSKHGITPDPVSDKRVCYHVIGLSKMQSRVLRFKINRAGAIEMKLVGSNDSSASVQKLASTPELLLATLEREVRIVKDKANA